MTILTSEVLCITGRERQLVYIPELMTRLAVLRFVGTTASNDIYLTSFSIGVIVFGSYSDLVRCKTAGQ